MADKRKTGDFSAWQLMGPAAERFYNRPIRDQSVPERLGGVADYFRGPAQPPAQTPVEPHQPFDADEAHRQALANLQQLRAAEQARAIQAEQEAQAREALANQGYTSYPRSGS